MPEHRNLDQHPDGHGDHHQVLDQRDEAQGHVAVTTDAGAFDLSLVDVDRLVNRHSANGADEEAS